MSDISTRQKFLDQLKVARPSRIAIADDPHARAAFQGVGLDVANPAHREAYLWAATRALHRRGKPDFNELLIDGEKVLNGASGGRQEACRRLRRKLPDKYPYTQGTLYKYVQDAGDFKKNPRLNELVKGRSLKKKGQHKLYSRKPSFRPPRPPKQVLVWIKGRFYFKDKRKT